MKDSKEVDIEKDPRALRYFNSFFRSRADRKDEDCKTRKD